MEGPFYPLIHKNKNVSFICGKFKGKKHIKIRGKIKILYTFQICEDPFPK